MYPAWQWGGTAAAVSGSPTAAAFVQPTVASTEQTAATQWPANYSQYATLTPEMQQQWAAAWASQAQLAYSGSVPVAGQVPTTGAYPGLTVAQPQTSTNSQTAEKPKTTASDEAQLDPEEEEFERQFKDWEKQFETWKEQNINHPDKEAFAQYEKQWQEWRAQLLQKKEQMQKAKAERLAAKMAQAVPTPGQPVPTGADGATADPNVAADPNLYYQQYMYMQNYMYQTGQAVNADGSQQYPYGADGYGAQPGSGQMNAPNINAKEQDDYNYGQPGANFPQGEPYQNYDEYGNSMYPPEGDDQYQREMGFGRGRGGRGRGPRGARGRGRGRGGWVTNKDIDGGQGALLDNPDFRGDGDFPREGDFPPGPGGFPPDRRNFPPGEFDQGNFPPRGPQDYPPDDFRDGPNDYPPDDFEGGRGGRRPFPPNGRFKKGMLPRGGDRNNEPPGISEQPSSRYPPDDFDEPPFEDGFPPPDGDRFPFPHRGKNGRFMMDRGDFDGPFPPMEGDRFGPPPFRDDGFPPFDDRFPPGRGRFPPRGRFPRGRGGFDRYGPPPDFPPDDFGPPDDRFGFPGDGPPRRGRGGMRPPFGPPGGRFPPDEPPFFEDGRPPPMHFKSIDYSHRSGDDFNPHYDYENEFQDDVGQFRAKGAKRSKRSPPPRKDKEPVEKKSRE